MLQQKLQGTGIRRCFCFISSFSFTVKTFALLLLYAVLLSVSVQAQVIEHKFAIALKSGYQQESLHWSIAGNSNGSSPNILSELRWKNLGAISSGINASWKIWRGLTLSGSYTTTFTISGNVSDMDYTADNRTAVSYAENFAADKGSTASGSACLGYELKSSSGISFTPALGYVINRDLLYLTDHTGRFPALNSSYKTNWKGLFISLNAGIALAPRLKVSTRFTYNQVNYRATGDWNLRTQFEQPVSYRHRALAYGLEASAELTYALCKNLSVEAGSACSFWQTGNGTDQLYLSNGSTDHTQLNQVLKSCYQLNAGLKLQFE